MSRRNREKRVSLEGLTQEQRTLLDEDAVNWLVAKADDLPPAGTAADNVWTREVEEVAALGRLISGLRSGWVRLSDRIARDLVARLTSETEHLDDVTAEYRKAMAEQESWLAILAHFAGERGGDS
jgi:hypothetical protein